MKDLQTMFLYKGKETSPKEIEELLKVEFAETFKKSKKQIILRELIEGAIRTLLSVGVCLLIEYTANINPVIKWISTATVILLQLIWLGLVLSELAIITKATKEESLESCMKALASVIKEIVFQPKYKELKEVVKKSISFSVTQTVSTELVEDYKIFYDYIDIETIHPLTKETRTFSVPVSRVVSDSDCKVETIIWSEDGVELMTP